MIMWILFMVGLCLCSFSNSQIPDPLCVAKNCPAQTTCRVVAQCTTPQSCVLEAQCLTNPPRFSHTGVCITGEPILTMRNGQLDDTHCGLSMPCPVDTYCNTELMDTYATCCRSDPANTTRPGNCPANTFTNDDFCLDTCIHDGDCRDTSKCCHHGCNMECVPPEPHDPCSDKICPRLNYCQREGMPRCTMQGKCYSVGDCVPCPPVCQIYCMHGNVLDPNGCPTCRCKTGNDSKPTLDEAPSAMARDTVTGPPSPTATTESTATTTTTATGVFLLATVVLATHQFLVSL